MDQVKSTLELEFELKNDKSEKIIDIEKLSRWLFKRISAFSYEVQHRYKKSIEPIESESWN
jgi:hypothetical protein